MKLKEGIALVVQTKDKDPQQLLFGPKKNSIESSFSYERISTNGLELFDSIRAAQLRMIELLCRSDIHTDLIYYAQMGIYLPDDLDDYGELSEKGPYIVISEKEEEQLLLGKLVNGIPGDAYSFVSEYERNGLRPIRNFQRATLARSEIERQAQSSAKIARVELRRIA